MSENSVAASIAFWTVNDYVDTWNLSATTSAANHGVDNLKNPERTVTWRSATNAPVVIEGANPAIFDVVDVDSFVIINHNWGWSVNLHLELLYNAEVLWDTIIFAKPHANLPDTRELIDELQLYQNRVFHIGKTISGVNKWRISTNINGGEAYHEIGRVFVSKAFRPKTSWSRAPMSPDDKSIIKESYGLNKSVDIRPIARKLEITPNALVNLDIPEMLRLIHKYGKRRPVFVDTTPQIPDKIFTTGDEAVAYRNLLWQLYGRLLNSVELEPGSGTNIITMPGIMTFIEEG